jgi:hypothetical protein
VVAGITGVILVDSGITAVEIPAVAITALVEVRTGITTGISKKDTNGSTER